MAKQDSWPFEETKDTAAAVDTDVMEGHAPVLLVMHFTGDEGWAFLSGEAFEPARGRLITMSEAVDKDASLRMIADLPPGWTATRSEVGGVWDRQRDPDI